MVSRRKFPIEIDAVESVKTTEIDRILTEGFSERERETNEDLREGENSIDHDQLP